LPFKLILPASLLSSQDTAIKLYFTMFKINKPVFQDELEELSENDIFKPSSSTV